MSSRLSETIGKLKGKSSSSFSSNSPNPMPSFRFNKADGELFEVFATPDPAKSSSSISCESTADETSDASEELPPESSSQKNNLGAAATESLSSVKDSSPIKEAILTKFSKLAPNDSGVDVNSASWLNQMKGRIAKTVEEKYTEYKNEKERRQQRLNILQNSMSLDLPLEPEPGTTSSTATITAASVLRNYEGNPFASDLNEGDEVKLPHSRSENLISTGSNETSEDDTLKTPTPAATETTSSPVRERRKFNFSFRSSPAKSAPSTTTPTTSSTASTPTSGEIAAASTPNKTSSLKSRMMYLMGKASQGNSGNSTSSTIKDEQVSMKELNDESEADLEFTEISAIDAEDNIETGLEADEHLTFEASAHEADTVISCPKNDQPSLYLPTLPSASFLWIAIAPLTIILLVQILPVHYWITGLLTGILVGGSGAFYISLKLFQDDSSPRTKFVEIDKTKAPKLNAIIVQEEMERKEVWMNLWPSKYGQYDPLTYDVRRTVSVRVELYGSWLELRFPKRNIPLRRMYDEVEQDIETMAFYEHKEVIDLTNATIELLPENLPSKRMWSKKYPIRIRTNSRKTNKSNKIATPDEANKSFTDISQVDCDDENLVFDDALEETLPNDGYDEDSQRQGTQEPTNSFLTLPNEDSKTYYLFTRTSREKEEWYNRFRVAAKFMEDWEHQNPEPGTKVDPDYTTFKQKEQQFKLFMEDYFQAKTGEEARKKHEENAENPEKVICAKEQLAFINIYCARMWFDLHKSKEFVDFLREKITRKLLKIKIAQYFEEVSVTTLDLGQKIPQILSASLPWQDELGLWVDLELEYFGICQATVETNGIRLPSKDEPDREAQELSRQAAVLDSDEEDSAEEDDDVTDFPSNDLVAGGDLALDPTGGTPGGPGAAGNTSAASGNPGGFRARMLDSLLKSDLLAKVAETEWVKKNITGKNITLKLQLHSLKGTLTLNFPPDPSDRIWYGFRTPPTLDIALKPCFGGKSLDKYEGTFSTVMKLLEKRLKQEFMKVLVFPNLDDEVLPFMDHVPYSIHT